MSIAKLDAQAEIDPTGLDNPALAFMHAYWTNLRSGRAMPARADIKPTDFKSYLDSLAMVDVIDGGDEFRYRLVGTALTQYFFVDPTGKTTVEAWPPKVTDIAERVRTNLRAVVRLRRPVHIWGTLEWPSFGREPFDALYLPFSDDGQTVTTILNLFTFDRRRVLQDRQAARQTGRTRLLDP